MATRLDTRTTPAPSLAPGARRVCRTPRQSAAAGHGRAQRHAGFLFRRRTLSRSAGAPSRTRGGLAAEGADILDIGAESTRPYGGAGRRAARRRAGAARAGIAGCRRARRARFRSIRIKAAVAAWALDQGAAIVNDVWGLQRDPDMARVVAERGVPVIIMHNRDARRSGHRHRRRRDGVLRALAGHRRARRHRARADRARSRHRLRQDAGAEHDLHRAARRIQALRPAAPGRRFAQAFHQFGRRLRSPMERLGGSIAAHLLAVENGAAIVRVHDVAPTVQALASPRRSGAHDERPHLHQRTVLHAYHGVMPHEAKVGQTFTLDLMLDIDLGRRRALATRSRTRLLRQGGEDARARPSARAAIRLIEAAAGAVADAVLDRFPRDSQRRASPCTSRTRRSPRPSAMSA